MPQDLGVEMASSKGLAKHAAVALGCAGAAVAAPFLAPYLATVSLPFIGTVLAGVLNADDFGKKLGDAIANTSTGLLTSFGAASLEEIPTSLTPDHNYHLELLLGTAYLKTMTGIETSRAVSHDETLSVQITALMPL